MPRTRTSGCSRLRAGPLRILAPSRSRIARSLATGSASGCRIGTPRRLASPCCWRSTSPPPPAPSPGRSTPLNPPASGLGPSTPALRPSCSACSWVRNGSGSPPPGRSMIRPFMFRAAPRCCSDSTASRSIAWSVKVRSFHGAPHAPPAGGRFDRHKLQRLVGQGAPVRPRPAGSRRPRCPSVRPKAALRSCPPSTSGRLRPSPCIPRVARRRRPRPSACADAPCAHAQEAEGHYSVMDVRAATATAHPHPRPDLTPGAPPERKSDRMMAALRRPCTAPGRSRPRKCSIPIGETPCSTT